MEGEGGETYGMMMSADGSQKSELTSEMFGWKIERMKRSVKTTDGPEEM